MRIKHSYKYKESRVRKGNALFNDALNPFYLRLYVVGHMVKDHSDSERGNPLPPHRLLFSISSKGYFYMHHPTDRITHTTAFVTAVVEHWLEREIAQCVHPMKDRSNDPSNYDLLYSYQTGQSCQKEVFPRNVIFHGKRT